MKYKHEITSEDEIYVKGKTFVQMQDNGPWEFSSTFIQAKKRQWFEYTPHEILKNMGIVVDERRAKELVDLIDGDLGGFYYVGMASDGTDEAIKWIMSSLAAILNDRGLSFSNINDVLPADYLAAFISYLKEGKIERSFSKDIFSEFLKAERFEEKITFKGYCIPHGLRPPKTDAVVRIKPNTILERIISDPRFKATDAGEIDILIDQVVQSNPEQVAKLAAKPALLQFFVGQVMKLSKGKAPAAVVQAKLKEKFGM